MSSETSAPHRNPPSVSVTANGHKHSSSPLGCLTFSLQWVRRVFDAYMFFWFLLVASIYIFGFVPQVANVWQQPPPWGTGKWWFIFPSYTLLLVLFYGFSCFVVLAPPWRESLRTDCPKKSKTKPQRGTLVLVIGLTALAMGAPSDNSEVYPLIGSSCRGLGLILAAVGLWLLAGCREIKGEHDKARWLSAGWQRGYLQFVMGAVLLLTGFIFDKYQLLYLVGPICRGIGFVLVGTGFCLWFSDPARSWKKRTSIGCLVLIVGFMATVVGLDLPAQIMTKQSHSGPDWWGISVRSSGLILLGIGCYLVFASPSRWKSFRFWGGFILVLVGAYGPISWIEWSMMQYPSRQDVLENLWKAVLPYEIGLILILFGIRFIADPSQGMRNRLALGTAVFSVGIAGISSGWDFLNASIAWDGDATDRWFAMLCRGPGLILIGAGLSLLFRPSPVAQHGEEHVNERGEESEKVRRSRRWYIGRLLSWLLATACFGEALWILAYANPWELFSYRIYTLWAVLQTLAVLVLLGLLIDRLWHLYKEWPIRQAATVLLILGFWLFTHWETLSPNEAERHLSPGQIAIARKADKIAANNPERATEDRERRWFEQFLKRVRSIPEGQGPVVLVAASGGGSRAAIFTALTLETLLRTPLDPTTPLIATPDLHKQGVRSWGDNIVLISSVSGGSLATAYFVHELAEEPDHPQLVCLANYKCREHLQNTPKRQLILHLRNLAKAEIGDYPSRLKERADSEIEKEYAAQITPLIQNIKLAELKRMRAQLLTLQRNTLPIAAANIMGLTGFIGVPGGWNPLLTAASLNKGITKQYAIFLDMLNQVIARIQSDKFADRLAREDKNAGPEEGIPENWVLQSVSFDEMCTDFMAPLMRGVLSPTLDRGDALARFWTKRFNWTDSTNLNGYTAPVDRSNYLSLDPLIMFNTYNVLQGSRLVIGFPPVPAKLWQMASETKGANHARLQSLDELAPNFRVSLARAVRLSSNFPFGFRVSALEKQIQKNDSTKDTDNTPEWIHMLDGGVIDNTGIDVIYELFKALKDHSESAHSPFRQDATTILDELRRRGVVILEIDAGEKPSPKMFKPWDPFGGPREPLRGLNNASYTNADVVKQFYIQELRGILKRNLDSWKELASEVSAAASSSQDPLPETVTHLIFQCNHYLPGEDHPDPEVMTAWALGPKGKAQIVQRFLIELEVWDLLRQDAYWDTHKRLGEIEFAEGHIVVNIISTLSRHYDELLKDLSPNTKPEELRKRKDTLDKRREHIERAVKRVTDKHVADVWKDLQTKSTHIDRLIARSMVPKNLKEMTKALVPNLADLKEISESGERIESVRKKSDQMQTERLLLQASTFSDPQWKFDLPARRSKMLLESQTTK